MSLHNILWSEISASGWSPKKKYYHYDQDDSTAGYKCSHKIWLLCTLLTACGTSIRNTNTASMHQSKQISSNLSLLHDEFEDCTKKNKIK